MVMTNNKLTLEDQFLNFSQAKELKELGIDFENGNYLIWNESEEIIAKSDILGFIGDDYTPTLSVAEMMEMLPSETCISKSDEFYHDDNRRYYVWNRQLDYDGCEQWEHLLRDALFEILKWLKQNKLI